MQLTEKKCTDCNGKGRGGKNVRRPNKTSTSAQQCKTCQGNCYVLVLAQ